MGRKWRSRKVLRCNEITTTTNGDNNHKKQNTTKRFGIKKRKPWTLVSFCSFSLVLGWSLRTLAPQNFRFTWWLQITCYIGGGKAHICQLTSWRFNQYWNGVRKKFIQTSFFFISTTREKVMEFCLHCPPSLDMFRPPVWLLLLSTARGEVSEVPSPLRVAISGQGTLSQSLNERVERNHDSALQMIQQLCYYIISSMH